MCVYPLSFAYPIVVGLSLAILNVLSGVYLGELIGLPKVLGMIFIVAGVYLLQRDSVIHSDR